MIDPLPKVIAGINEESTESIRKLYGTVYGLENLIVLDRLEAAEEFKSHKMLLQHLCKVKTEEEQLVDAC